MSFKRINEKILLNIMNSKVGKNKNFKDYKTHFSTNAFSFLVYPPRKIKYNILQEKNF